MIRIDVVTVLLFVGSVSCMIFANIIDTIVVGEVNRRSPVRKESYLWWTPAKARRLNAEYRKYFPLGKLHYYAWILGILGSLLMVGCVVWSVDFSGILSRDRPF